MRTKYSILNSIVGVIYKVFYLLSSFVVRYFFAKYLLSDYLGLEGLFLNIVGFFSLADLGIGAAISFSLYKPLHNKNQDLIDGIMKLFKKVYITIGVIIIVLALITCCFIPMLVSDTVLPTKELIYSFLLYTIGVAITYFFSYNRTLLFATQRNYVVLIVDTIIKIMMSICQILAIVKFKNYYLYLLVVLIFNFVSNYIVTMYTKRKKLYNKKTDYTLGRDYKLNLIKQIKALALSNVCGRLIVSTDNIIISMICGLTELAINANYSLIVSGLNSLVSVFLSGPSASIGDLIVEGNTRKINDNFNKLCFIAFFFSTFCSLGFFLLSKPFVSIWVGNKYLFNDMTTFVLSLNIFLLITVEPIRTFQNMAGLFVFYQRIVVIAVIINLFFSIVLSSMFGVIGVFLGTTLCYLYQIYYFTKLLYKKLLKRNSNEFYKNMRYFIIDYIMIIILFYCFLPIINTSNLIINLIYDTVLFLVLFSIFSFILLKKNTYWIYFLNYIKRISRRN